MAATARCTRQGKKGTSVGSARLQIGNDETRSKAKTYGHHCQGRCEHTEHLAQSQVPVIPALNFNVVADAWELDDAGLDSLKCQRPKVRTQMFLDKAGN
jgi:hypothetical protein